MSTDVTLERRLHDLYAVTVPVALDRHIATAVAFAPARESRRVPARRIAVVAIVAVLATVAAGQGASWFAGWDARHDRLWELGTPVDQTAIADDYRVTVHRAYADALGVQLAISVVDLDDRWSELYIDAAEVTDADGRTYAAWNWSLTRSPANGTAATWSRFALPGDAPDRDLQLHVAVTGLAVRAPEPLAREIEPEQIWSSVAGNWTFDVDVPVVHPGRTVQPVASSTVGGVTVTLQDIGLVPSGPFAHLAVQGLPELPAGAAWNLAIKPELEGGQALTEHILQTEDRLGDAAFLVEIVPGDDVLGIVQAVGDLTGHWTITVSRIAALDPATEREIELLGPWVLEFDVPPEAAP